MIKVGTVNGHLEVEKKCDLCFIGIQLSGELFERQLWIYVIKLDLLVGEKCRSELHFTLSCISSTYE